MNSNGKNLPKKESILQTSVDIQSALIKDLNPQSSLVNMMDEIVEKTATYLDASACTIFIVNQGQGNATQLAGTGYQKQFNGKTDVPVIPLDQVAEEPEEDEEIGLTGWILSTGRSFFAKTFEELRQHPHHSGRRDYLQIPGYGSFLTLKSFLGVPIRGLHGEVIGLIKAERLIPKDKKESDTNIKSFSVQDQLALETISRIVGKSITYHEIAGKGCQEEAITAWGRDVITEAVATEGELDTFLGMIVKLVSNATRADSCGIFLKDESGKTLTQRAGIGSQALHSIIRAYSLPDPQIIQKCKDAHHCTPANCLHREKKGSELEIQRKLIGLTPWIAATGKSFYAPNFCELSNHCFHRGGFDDWNFPKDEECGAFFGVPLQIGGTIIGVIKIENISPKNKQDQRDFSAPEEQRLEVLAQDIAMAITRLQIQIPGRYTVIHEAQRTILEILRGGLDIPKLSQKVVDETMELFNAGACALFLKEGKRLVQRAANGWAEIGPEVRAYELVDEKDIKENPNRGEFDAKKEFRDKNLVLKLLNEKILIEVDNGSGSVRFDDSITNENILRERLGQIENHDIEHILDVWRNNKDERVGLTVWIAVKQQKFTARSNLEIRMHPHHKGTFDIYNFPAGEQCETIMGFPLLIKEGEENKLIGVFKVETKKTKSSQEFTYFNELDVLMFELITNSVATAIQNARLQQQSREKLKAQLQAEQLKEISSRAAHRINNQVTRYDYIELVLQEEAKKLWPIKKKLKVLSGEISEATQTLKKMISEFREFGKAITLKRESCNLNDILQRQVAQFQKTQKNIKIEFHADNTIPKLDIDTTRFPESITELLSNAVKSINNSDNPNEGEIKIYTELIKNKEKEYTKITIQDNGRGIPKDFPVFEPYKTTNPEGTGLGLSTVKELIELHGGSIKFDPNEKAGAKLLIEIPV